MSQLNLLNTDNILAYGVLASSLIGDINQGCDLREAKKSAKYLLDSALNANHIDDTFKTSISNATDELNFIIKRHKGYGDIDMGRISCYDEDYAYVLGLIENKMLESYIYFACETLREHKQRVISYVVKAYSNRIGNNFEDFIVKVVNAHKGYRSGSR